MISEVTCLGVLGLEPRASALSVQQSQTGLFEALTYSNLIKFSTDVQAQTAIKLGQMGLDFVRQRRAVRQRPLVHHYGVLT